MAQYRSPGIYELPFGRNLMLQVKFLMKKYSYFINCGRLSCIIFFFISFEIDFLVFGNGHEAFCLKIYGFGFLFFYYISYTKEILKKAKITFLYLFDFITFYFWTMYLMITAVFNYMINNIYSCHVFIKNC